MGCVLYGLLCGFLPFNDTFLPRLQMNIMNGKFNSAKLKEFMAANELVLGMLELNPTSRWDSYRILAHPWVKGGSF